MSAAIGLLPISVAYNLRGFMSTSVELIVYFRKRAEEGQLIDDIRDRVRQLIVYYCTPSMDLGERKDRIDIIEHLAHGLKKLPHLPFQPFTLVLFFAFGGGGL